MKKTTKKYYVIIENKDGKYANSEQFTYYQHNGETVQVAIGVKQEVPEWVAKRAKEIGDVTDYIEIEVGA